MNDHFVLAIMKKASLNNNTQLRSSYEEIKKGFEKNGEATDEHKKLALFLAAKKFVKQSVYAPAPQENSNLKANTPGTPGANIPTVGASTSAPVPDINPAPPLKPVGSIAKSDIKKSFGGPTKAVTMQSSGKRVMSSWTRW
jgi:hypothetical protein